MAKSPFELNQLRCFLTVAEELNFRRAAGRLGMTQPPLSRQIKLLEDAIGLRLLDRDNRSVRLTPAGESFRASAADLLERAEYAVLTARQAERGEVGAVSMGFVPSAALDFVPRIVAAIKREMPGIAFDPIEMVSYEIVEALLAGRIDLGLTRTPGHRREIDSIRVVREPFILAFPLDHRFSSAPSVALDDLHGEPLVGYSVERGGYLRDIQSALFAAAGIRPDIVQRVSQTQTVVALVNVGLGVALVPRSAMAMHMDNLGYRTIDIPDPFTSTLFLNVAPNRTAPLHRQVRALIARILGGPDADAGS